MNEGPDGFTAALLIAITALATFLIFDDSIAPVEYEHAVALCETHQGLERVDVRWRPRVGVSYITAVCVQGIKINASVREQRP